MIIDLSDAYRRITMMMMIIRLMMMIMTMRMMIKTPNGHNSANFEATFSRFCMVIDLNDTYRLMMTMMMIKTQNGHNYTTIDL